MEERIYRPATPRAWVWAMLVCVSWLACTRPGLAQAQSQSRALELFVGQTEVLAHKGVVRVAVGNGKLADVKILKDGRQILLIAKQSGFTDLHIWFRDGRQLKRLVHILSQPPDEILAQVRAQLGDLEGVHARLAGERVVIEGQSLRAGDLARVKEVAKQFPGVVNYVTAGGVTMRGMVFLDVKVVEVKKTELKKIGVNWEDLAAGPTYANLDDFQTNPIYRGTGAPTGTNASPVSLPLNAGHNNAFFGISTRITSVINLLSQSGDARMLAEPKLTCRSGGHAQFLAGGEVPIPITDRNGALNVTFKQYGIILKMSPTSDPQGYIETRIEVEVSTIDAGVSVLGIPGFLTRKTETDMNVRQGQTMVISGLLNSERSKDVDKLPGLGNLPILGELFKSRQFRDNETELVVLVTPRLVGAEHPINKRLIKRAAELRRESGDRLRFKLMD